MLSLIVCGAGWSSLPGREGVWGGKAHDNRRFINAVFWILRTGAPWLRITATGRIPIGVFAVGVIVRHYWNRSLLIQILKGYWVHAGRLIGGMTAVIPPRKHRKVMQHYDKAFYKLRPLVENAFLHLKCWRGIATLYAKNTASFHAAIQVRCIALWTNIL